MKTCMCCFNPATHISSCSPMCLCDDCYISMADDFEASMEDEVGCSFDEYYDFVEVNDED